MALITAVIGLATLAVSRGWMGHYMGIVFSGAKAEPQTAAVPAFPSCLRFSQGILAGLGELPTSEIRWLGQESFLRSASALRRLPAAAAVRGLTKDLRALYCEYYPNIATYILLCSVSRQMVLATIWKVCLAKIASFFYFILSLETTLCGR